MPPTLGAPNHAPPQPYLGRSHSAPTERVAIECCSPPLQPKELSTTFQAMPLDNAALDCDAVDGSPTTTSSMWGQSALGGFSFFNPAQGGAADREGRGGDDKENLGVAGEKLLGAHAGSPTDGPRRTPCVSLAAAAPHPPPTVAAASDDPPAMLAQIDELFADASADLTAARVAFLRVSGLDKALLATVDRAVAAKPDSPIEFVARELLRVASEAKPAR